MSYTYKPKTKLNELKYITDSNPLLQGLDVQTKKKKIVRTQFQTPVLETGEIHCSNIFSTKEIDEKQFVKVFNDGVKAMFDLTQTAHRVFCKILEEYEKEPMTGGYIDAIQLAWFNGGLSGESIGMHKRTFNRGLAELIDKRFLAPKAPNTYWVNPSLFFRGDRVRFINEFKVKRTKELRDGAKDNE